MRLKGLVEAVRRPDASALRFVLKRVALAGLCHVSIEVGFAHKVPPHNISPLWPTNAILFGVLVVAPVRRWWGYVPAAYVSSLIGDARAGFPLSGVTFLLADIVEVSASSSASAARRRSRSTSA